MPDDKKRGSALTEFADKKVEPAIGINPAAIRGEAGTGYEPRVIDGIDMGLFRCGDCHYFVGPVGKDGPKRGEKGCNQSDMRRKSELPRWPDGRVEVDVDGCCSYVERVRRA